jgi:AraC-like DNA-binding protein
MKHMHQNLLAAHHQPGLSVVQALFLLQLKIFLDQNLANTGMNASMVAKAMGMSKSTLNRRLKTLLHMIISNFVRQYKLQWAADFLAAGYKVNEVSVQAGFKSPSYFAQCFKTYYQKTPSEFSQSRN